MGDEDIQNLKYFDLKNKLLVLGVEPSGNKDELRGKLKEALAKTKSLEHCDQNNKDDLIIDAVDCSGTPPTRSPKKYSKTRNKLSSISLINKINELERKVKFLELRLTKSLNKLKTIRKENRSKDSQLNPRVNKEPKICKSKGSKSPPASKCTVNNETQISTEKGTVTTRPTLHENVQIVKPKILLLGDSHARNSGHILYTYFTS